MAFDFDSVIIGAGVIGLAIARACAQAGGRVLVLEKAASAGTETSSRNSEVIHAGLYYPPGSLKARLCVEGRDLLYAYCASRGVEARRTGKLIVASRPEEVPKLEAIMAQAKANGVNDLAWLAPADVAALEPELRCTRALLSPSTGIVDSQGLMQSLQADAGAAGADFAFHTCFASARRADGGFVIAAQDAQRAPSEVTCAHLYNCAGHGAHAAARAIERFPANALPPQHFAKGCYCNVSGKSPFRRLVYPVPVPGALGIHATLDLAGNVRFGPDISWTEGVDYDLPDGVAEKFAAAIEPYWPGVMGRRLVPSYCGVRPKIHGLGESFADFEIQGPRRHGMAGLVNLFGLESPGLTASLAVAAYATRLMKHST